MSILTILILLVLLYYCAKAIGNIWHDTFKGTTTDQTRRANQTHRKEQYHHEGTQSKEKTHSHSQKPIEKGEGEYIDFTEEV